MGKLFLIAAADAHHSGIPHCSALVPHGGVCGLSVLVTDLALPKQVAGASDLTEGKAARVPAGGLSVGAEPCLAVLVACVSMGREEEQTPREERWLRGALTCRIRWHGRRLLRAANGDSGSGTRAFLGLGVTTVPGVCEVTALLFLIRNSFPRTAKLQNLVSSSVL